MSDELPDMFSTRFGESRSESPAQTGAAIDLKGRFKFLPEITTGAEDGAAADWDLELEGRYREDTPAEQVDFNFGRARVEVRWLEDIRCILACRSASDKHSLADLNSAGRRAVLGVHRYIGRVRMIRRVPRSQWLGPIVVTYCYGGGPREFDTTDLMRASAKASAVRVKELIRNGANVNAENLIGETALSYSAREGRLDVFEILSDNGARTPVDFEGHTLLHEASMGGSVPIIGKLLRDGLNINGMDWMGLTPIWFAVSEGNAEAAEYLLSEGADWRVEPWRSSSAFPKMKDGFNLVRQAEAALGPHHRFTKMLQDLHPDTPSDLS